MIRWGVLGLGNIAHRFCESLSYFEDAEFYAGASRTQEKCDAFPYQGKVMYTDYEAFLSDPDIDIVYIALVHSLHYEWAKKALEHGKSVLVEKPVCLSLSELEELVTLARSKGLFLMEALKSPHIPLMKDIHHILNEGTIGDLVSVENHFDYVRDYTPGAYIWDGKEGGAFLDTASYTLGVMLEMVGEEAESFGVESRYAHGVDVYDDITLSFPSGVTGHMTTSMDSEPRRFMVISGTKGTITCEPFYRPEEALISVSGQEDYVIRKPYVHDDFHGEIAAANECVRNAWCEHPLMTHADSERLLRGILVIHREIQARK